MKAKVIQLNPYAQEAALTEAAEILRRGGIIVYPTDTQYGLGIRYDQEAAIGKIFKIKARDAGKPVPVLIGSVEEVADLVSEITPLADFLIRKFWPGPLTIVFRASE
ncbi:MAG TPA: Sua5/YciO/YrdC/YwlC family protein, partial [Nitrospiria bacterium]|nr:Sua5/YciO/YrdC/YwlC family protein [Nitrospiria bacterium]